MQIERWVLRSDQIQVGLFYKTRGGAVSPPGGTQCQMVSCSVMYSTVGVQYLDALIH